MTESDHIKLGAYHTVELAQQRAFTLHKACWDAIDIERIKQACDVQLSADLAAVLITVSRYTQWHCTVCRSGRASLLV